MIAAARLPARSESAKSQLFRLCQVQHNRNNWLFGDTVGGSNASANLYSLIETCKANGVDPYAYLVHLLRKLPCVQTADDYEVLLPWLFASSER